MSERHDVVTLLEFKIRRRRRDKLLASLYCQNIDIVIFADVDFKYAHTVPAFHDGYFKQRIIGGELNIVKDVV